MVNDGIVKVPASILSIVAALLAAFAVQLVLGATLAAIRLPLNHSAWVNESAHSRFQGAD
jgi:hypothetical protein